MQVRILCPDVEDHTGLNGQLLEIEVASLLDTVADIKARLAEVLALPGNKQRITRDGVGVLQVCRPMAVPSHLVPAFGLSSTIGCDKRQAQCTSETQCLGYLRCAGLACLRTFVLNVGLKLSTCFAGCQLLGALQCGTRDHALTGSARAWRAQEVRVGP